MKYFMLAMIILFAISIAAENDVFGSAIILGTIVGLHWYGVDIVSCLPQSGAGIVFVIGGYFFIGIVWSIFRFYVYYKKVVSALYNRYKSDNKSIEEIRRSVEMAVPRVSDMKSDIIMWIGLWPVNVLRYIIGDLLYDVANKIYGCIKAVYEKIAKSIIESMFK